MHLSVWRLAPRSWRFPSGPIWPITLLIASVAVFGNGTGATALASQPAMPDISAAAVYIVDVSADVTLYAENADARRPPASLVKMMTALVTVDHANWDESVTIVPGDQVDVTEYSHVGETGLIAGDTLTVGELLQGLLIPSGNDAARTLARVVGATLPGGNPNDGAASRAAFVAEMNAKAEQLGMTETHFANSDGIDDPDQYVSARDLATLAANLLENERLAEIVQQRTAELVSIGPEARLYTLNTTNTLLLDPDNPYGVHGVKTGTTGNAGGNLVSAAYFGNQNRVIAVVLGSTFERGEQGIDERYPDTLTIFAALLADYAWVDPANPIEAPNLAGLGEELRVWQVSLPPGPAVPVPADQLADLRYFVQLGPAAEPGAAVGEVHFFVGDAANGRRAVVQA